MKHSNGHSLAVHVQVSFPRTRISRAILGISVLTFCLAPSHSATRARFTGEGILKDAGARISAGDGYACQVKEDGRIRCWGNNSNGQLGNNSTTNSLTPVLVSGLTNGVAISAGESHACAVLADGTAWCWGRNNKGQLGDGTTTTRLAPVKVNGLSQVVAISAEGAHTCALTSFGFVRCWGDNHFGQLGIGNKVDQHTPAATLVSNAVAIATGTSHSCAVLADGTAQCWGLDFAGELGVGSSGGIGAESTVPLRVHNVRSAVAISADFETTCVLLSSGAAQCWGNNPNGEVGDGTVVTPRSTPTLVVGLNNAVSIDVGPRQACASIVDGTVRCWGANNNGQLGEGVIGDDRPSPGFVTGSAFVTAVSSGTEFSCALLAEGSVSCWGANTNGELGVGNTRSPNPTPAPVFGGGGTFTARAIVAGREHTCAVRANSTVACWGNNDSGQIGDGTTGGIRLSPVAVPGLLGVTALAAGDAHTCALLVSGTVQCWGLNSTGQLGDGTLTSRPTPLAVSGLTNIIAITAGGALGSSHTCALQVQGQVLCWGANGSGQVGNGTTSTSVLRPTRLVTTSLGPSVPAAVGIAAGAFHTCARFIDGTSACWGFNSNGQVGDGSTFSTHVLPVFVSGMGNAVALAAGDFHSCALVAVGAMFCWGTNGNNQLGSNGGAGNKPSPVLISLDQEAIAAAAGFGHTCALVGSGGARCWGDNSSGQLGIASTVTNTAIPSVVKKVIGNLALITQPFANGVAITAGRRHTCGLIASGGAYCWGDNTSGQLGLGLTTPILYQPAGVPSFAVNIDPAVTMKSNARVAEVTVIAACDQGKQLQLAVNLEQGLASGSGRGAGKCTGFLERYPVNVPANGPSSLSAGAAKVSAEAVIHDGFDQETQAWTRAVTINAP